MNMIAAIFAVCLMASGAYASAAQAAVPMGCVAAFNKKACFASSDCYWCASSTFTGQQSICVEPMQAMHMPTWVYKCTHKKAPKGEEPVVAVTPAAGCSTPISQEECQQTKGCLWCEGTYTPGQGYCTDEQGASYVPADYYKCSTDSAATVAEVSQGGQGPVDPTPGAACQDAMDKKGCLDSPGCYWCDNVWSPGMGARCMDKMQAKFMPSTVYKCKKGKGKKPKPAPTPAPDADVAVAEAAGDDGKPAPGPDPTPAPTCSDAKDKKGCMDIAECAWCKNVYSPDAGSMCMDAASSKFIPATVFKCKASKKKAGADAEAEAEAGGQLSLFDTISSVWKSFSAGSGGAAPSPYAPPTPGGGGCSAAMDKKGCRAIADCYWCENKFTPGMGSRCADESQAKFMPDMVFKCKKSKQHRKDVSV